LISPLFLFSYPTSERVFGIFFPGQDVFWTFSATESSHPSGKLSLLPTTPFLLSLWNMRIFFKHPLACRSFSQFFSFPEPGCPPRLIFPPYFFLSPPDDCRAMFLKVFLLLRSYGFLKNIGLFPPNLPDPLRLLQITSNEFP